MLVSLKEMLKDAYTNKYAIGAFNCLSLENVVGAISAAEELHSPIIIQLAEVQFPCAPIALMAPLYLNAAKAASVPVAVHLDHDTDRFLKEMPTSLNAFKQAVTFLLTIPGIPQLYYGQELLMNGTKSKSDGYVRRDVPGGWPGDKANWFEASGRSDIQNEACRFR